MYLSLCLVGLSWIFLCQAVRAKSAASIADLGLNLSAVDERAESAPVWISQSPSLEAEAVIQITDVQLEPTESGLALLLQISTGQLLPVSPSVEGNDLVADISNAVLALPDGDEFQSVNPTDEVALVTVSNLSNNQVRVVITGVSEAPVAEVNASEAGLIFNVVQAAADEAVEDNTLRIVVTAEKTPEVLQDVPISLTVLTEDELEDADTTTLDGIAANTPNFSSFSATGSRSFTFYSIRGLSNQNFGSRDPVAFYVDDVPYDYGSFIDLDLPDLQQVEILRGPQNTLYGRSSQAGIVNIITRKPTNELSFNSAVSYGSEENVDLRAGISGPIIEDELFYRLSGNYERRDGFYDNSFLDEDYDEKSGGTGRAQLRWTPTETWDVSLNASFEDYQDGAYPFVALDDDDPFDIEQDFNGFSSLSTNSQSLKVAYLQPEFRVTSITTRRFSDWAADGEIDLTVADVLRAPSAFDSTVWTQELRLQAPEEAEQLQWIVGGYFESREFDNNGSGSVFGEDAAAVFGPTTMPGSSSVTTADSRDTTWATFGQVSYRPIDPLNLTVGLRYENTDSELSTLDQVFRIPGLPDTSLLSVNDVDQNSDAFLPRFAIDYRLSPEATVYGSISRGYRPGGVNVFADNEASFRFEAERSWNYEVGVKTTWLDDRLGVNLSLFHNPVDNYQVATFDPVTLFTDSVRNADVSITGLELDVRATPLEGLDFIAGLGLVDAEFTNFTDQTTGANFDGNSLPYAPEFTYNFAAQYRTSFGLFTRLELQGVGQTFFNEANTVEQDSYALVNARLGYEFDQYGVYLFANNLFDTRYIAQGFDFNGTRAGAFGAPATYGVQVRSSF
ncbi:hypothetical protein N836_12625 [Leptolyngbya sp. Heron Island J]|nr:hypothetical protein N836_12625 [Leptolyngbya sp. Heron Island J]